MPGAEIANPIWQKPIINEANFLNSPKGIFQTFYDNNPGLASSPYLAGSLYNQITTAANPRQVAQQLASSHIIQQVAAAYQHNQQQAMNRETFALDQANGQLYKQNQEKLYQSSGVLGQAAQTTSNAIHSAFGWLGNELGGFAGLIMSGGDKATALQDQSVFRNAFQILLGDQVSSPFTLIGNAVGGLAQKFVSGYRGAVEGQPQTAPPNPFSALGKEVFSSGSLPYTYANNIISVAHQDGVGAAVGQALGNIIDGMVMNNFLGTAAEAGSATELQSQAIDTLQTQIKYFEGLKAQRPLSVFEHQQLEGYVSQLNALDLKAGYQAIYDQYLEKATKDAPFSTMDILENQLRKGAITQSEYDASVAEILPPEVRGNFLKVAEQLAQENVSQRAAVDAQFEAEYGQARNFWRDLKDSAIEKGQQYKGFTGAVRATATVPMYGVKAVMTLGKLLGSRPANMAYVMGMLDANKTPEGAYLWSQAERGHIVNYDGSTTDVGSAIANAFGINGMWGTSIRDLIDLGLKWVVLDPLGSGMNLIGEARSAYGMTGALGKWFHGTGIFRPSDVDRAYAELGSFRTAVDVMAKSGAAKIRRDFGQLLSDKLISEIDKATTPEQVLDILRAVAAGTELTLNRVPTMGWYEFMKSSLRGAADRAKYKDLEGVFGDASLSTKQVEEILQRELKIKPPSRDPEWASAIPAEKAKITFFMRLRRMSMMKQMIVRGEGVSDKAFDPTDIRSVDGLVAHLKANDISNDLAESIGDMMIRAIVAHDNVRINNIFDNALLISSVRNFGPALAHPDFFRMADIIQGQLRDLIKQQSGVDGAGTDLDQAFAIHPDPRADQTITKDGEINKQAGITQSDLGKRVLPGVRKMRQMAKFVAKATLYTTETGAEKWLRDTNKTFAAVRDIAEAAGVNLVRLLPRVKGIFESTLQSDAFKGFEKEAERAAETGTSQNLVAEGYKAKSEEILKLADNIIKGQEFKDLTEAEKVATAIKYLDEAQKTAQTAYDTYASAMSREQFRINVERRRGEVPQYKEEIAFRLRGELQAVRDMNVTLKSTIATSSLTGDELQKRVEYIAAMEGVTKEGVSDAEARRLWAEKYLDRFNKKYERPVLGDKLGRLDNRVLYIKSLGMREFRTGADVAVDLMQGFLNSFWKMAALTTFGWADRVTASEVLQLANRFGLSNFFEAFVAKSIVKNETRFGKIAEGALERERFLYRLKNGVAHILLGIDKAVVDAWGSEKLQRFIDHAVNIYTLYPEMVLPGAVHAQDDVMSADNYARRIRNKVHYVENGRVQVANKITPNGFRKYMSGESMAGMALRRNIIRFGSDPVGAEMVKYLMSEIRTAGEKEFAKESEAHSEMVIQAANSKAAKIADETGQTVSDSEYDKIIAEERDRLVRELGSRKLGNRSDINRLRTDTENVANQSIKDLSPEIRSRFAHDTERSALYPELTPHEGWAKVLTDSTFNLFHDRNELFHELLQQAETGKVWDESTSAKWISERYHRGEPAPHHMPAPDYGSGFTPPPNFLHLLSDYLHDHSFGKIINGFSREPAFMLESFNMMENLRAKIEQNLIDEDQALVRVMTEASIRMTRFVHNPYDKTLFEEAMRVAAPFYFAKNQAMRRAIRMGIDNPGNLERYLKMNIAITDLVALGYNASGIQSFTFPGSSIVLGPLNLFMMNYLQWAYGESLGGVNNMGFSGSAASTESVIITGANPGLGAILENAIRIPWGPWITVPAKFVYEWSQYRKPDLANAIATMLGPQSLNNPIWADVVPNSTVKSILEGGYGYLSQNQSSSFMSSQLYVETTLGQNVFNSTREEVIKQLIDAGVLTQKTINSAAAQELINTKTVDAVSLKMNDPSWVANLKDEARAYTSALYVTKTAMAFGGPFSISVNASQTARNLYNQLAVEKNPDGTPKYSNPIAVLDAFYQKYPNEIFGLVAHSKATYGYAPETYGMVDFYQTNTQLAKENPWLFPYLAPSVGKAGQFDPVASSLLISAGLRQREASQDVINSMRVMLGNYYYYDILMPAYEKYYPGTQPGTLSSAGYYALEKEATSYGQQMNPVWLADHNSGSSKNAAYNAYGELQKLVKNTTAMSQLTKLQQEALPVLVQYRQNYEQEYLAAAGDSSAQNTLKQAYDTALTNLSQSAEFAPISDLVLKVFRDLPNPTQGN